MNAKDFSLRLPRLAPWSYGGAIAYETGLDDWGGIDVRVSADHRDAAWYNDQNTGLLRAATMIDASLTIRHDRTSLSLFGTILL